MEKRLSRDIQASIFYKLIAKYTYRLLFKPARLKFRSEGEIIRLIAMILSCDIEKDRTVVVRFCSCLIANYCIRRSLSLSRDILPAWHRLRRVIAAQLSILHNTPIELYNKLAKLHGDKGNSRSSIGRHA